MEEKILEEYSVVADWVSGDVKIKKVPGELVPIYEVKLPEIGKGTAILLDEIRERLVVEIPVKTAELLDITAIENLKRKFETKGLEMVRKKLPKIDEATAKHLVGLLIHEMLGLGILEMPLTDPNLEEVVVNTSVEPAWVYHKKFGWLKTNIKIPAEADILNFASGVGRKVGRQITILNPLMDAHLTTGDRVNSTLFPISTKGNTLTIRKFRRAPWTITDFIQNKTISLEVAAWVWLMIQYEFNMIVSGGTATGKTSLLNVFMSFIPPNHRVISIEDSVSGEEEVIIKQKNRIKRCKIKKLFNDSARDEIYPTDWKILSLNNCGEIEFKKIKKVIRHWCRKPLYIIYTHSGRKISTTGDHSLFSLDNKLNISPTKVSEIKIGGYIAVPRKLSFSNNLFEINLLEKLESKGLFIKGDVLKEFLESVTGRKFLIKYIPTKLRSMRRVYRRKEMLPLQLFKKLMKEFKWEKEKLNNLVLFRAKGRSNLPILFKLDEDFCFLAGCWIGDGCYDKQSVLISISDKEVLRRFERLARKYNFNIKKHSDKFTTMLNSTLLKELMLALGLSGDSYSRRIPEWVFSLPVHLKAEVLKGIFSAEGWVKKYEVAIASYSEELIRDIQTLLLNFGIIFRIGRYKDEKNKEFCEGKISSVKFLVEFYEKVGFEQISKTEKLKKLLSRKSKDVADIIPLPKHVYGELKYACREGMNITYKSWKSWHRQYRYSHIGREHLKQIILQTPEALKITNPLNVKDVLRLVVNDVLWDKIKTIEKVEYNGYVYDFSVEENENFVCNNIFAHNTRELILPKFLHWIPLTTREPNPEGKGGVSMLDLLINSLRMRPDRIIVGEIRRAREAEVLFEAMHTGHSVYATVHADTAEQTYRRLINPPISVPEIMLESLHSFTVCFRDRRLGIRRVFELAEIIPAGEVGRVGARISILYRWKPTKDIIEKENEIYRLIEELRMHTGMNEKEIHDNLKEKEEILKWFVKHNVNKVNAIGRVISEYYINPEDILKAIKQDFKPKEIIPPEFLKD
ncbi:MAG: ATPase, T2SS/T4P/T4SS family [Candidatus Aenigmarchaeota archaeon]|nr:ATPase, T2SS/T4P/T4SS family [Candidatus Aenigmarchaeota archaeon]